MNQKRVFISIIITGTILFAVNSGAQAQFLKNLKNQVKETVQETVEQRTVEKASNGTNHAIDKAASAAGSEAEKVLKGEKNENQDDPGISDSDLQENDPVPDNVLTSVAPSDYKSYDFVPGDKILFQPDLSTEADAELPARFSIKKGNAEIQSHQEEKVLHLNAGGYVIVTPLMSTENYLPGQFTLEFDMMYENDKDYFAYVNDFRIKFLKSDETNWDNYPLYEFKLHSNASTSFGSPNNSSAQNLNPSLTKAVQSNGVWHHIAIYVRQNIAKAYINQYRVNATNVLPTGAGKLAIATDGKYGFKIKNMRLAAGGDDKYNKIVTDGKFITHGIQFDVAKATLKPESMGSINEVAALMKNHEELKFEIRGHTDSDGAEDTNLTLSQDRADAVRNKLIELGIDESRLSSKGLGESQPIDNNDSAEGKANNRRVEFVKM